MTTAPSRVADAEPEEARSIVIERLIDAPRELVFRAFTTAEHLAHWWGPTGFSITTSAFDLRVGGVLAFRDARAGWARLPEPVVFDVIDPPARIVSHHVGGDDAEPASHETRVTLDAESGKTRLTWRLVFVSVAERDRIVREYGAVEGGPADGRPAGGLRLGACLMSLTLYYPPALVVQLEGADRLLRERHAVRSGVIVDETTHAAFLKVWPLGKFPVVVDTARGETVPESSAVIDYLDRYVPGPMRFTPADPDLAWRTRLWDRFFDFHIHEPMQQIVADRNRPAANKDPFGVEIARAKIAKSYDIAEAEASRRTWFSGDDFGLADCAAAPALFYADKVAAVRGRASGVARLLGPADGPALVRPGAQRGGTLLQAVSAGLTGTRHSESCGARRHSLLSFVETETHVRITSKGQVTIPADIRERAGLLPNTDVNSFSRARRSEWSGQQAQERGPVAASACSLISVHIAVA